MPELIHNTDEYLYEKKRDIFVLELKNQVKERMSFDRNNIANQQIEKEQLDWLTAHGISFAKTCSPGVLIGWAGHYFVDFSGWDDPAVAAYSAAFENDNGSSKAPDKFRMVALSYEEWVKNGFLSKHEQYLIDREDPNFEW